VRPAVKVARIAGASRHSRLETEPNENADFQHFTKFYGGFYTGGKTKQNKNEIKHKGNVLDHK